MLLSACPQKHYYYYHLLKTSICFMFFYFENLLSGTVLATGGLKLNFCLSSRTAGGRRVFSSTNTPQLAEQTAEEQNKELLVFVLVVV